MPDERWNELFAGLRSDRDRAILALGISTSARASELLGVRGCDLDWGEQLVRVRREGSGAEQWLPASAEAFVWVRLYLAGLDPLEPHEPVWWTLRRRNHGNGLRPPAGTDVDTLTPATSWRCSRGAFTATLRADRSRGCTRPGTSSAPSG